MDLSNGETMVDVPRNESRMGDSGRRTRSAASAYMLAGGSSETYSVTLNFDSGHFCKPEGGKLCKGNTWGKAKTYGPVNSRDTSNPVEWCKHVSACLSNVEAVAEAQDITRRTFGPGRKPETVKVKVKPAVPAFEVPVNVEPTPRERLATLEAEQAALKAAIEADEATNALRATVAELVKAHGWETVRKAVAEG